MKYSILTLFPELIAPFTQEAILGKAVARGQIEFELVNMRDFAHDKHNSVDDTPYGGGAGMVIRVDVVAEALAALKTLPGAEVILLTPAGQRFDQAMAEELAQKPQLVVLCGRYEGFDTRVEGLATREVSLGDFVMMGGEAAALCLIEATARLLPGVLGAAESHRADSFSSTLLDYPEYTRPLLWQDQPVPQVLRGGNHAAPPRPAGAGQPERGRPAPTAGLGGEQPAVAGLGLAAATAQAALALATAQAAGSGHSSE
jgi:tRNA (guanine37-N1)-methyltransferase